MFQGIRESVSKYVGGAKKRGFPEDRPLSDYGSGTQSIISGKFNKIGIVTVSPRQKEQYGYGKAEEEINQGFLKLDFQNSTPAQIEGTVRLKVDDPNGLTKDVVLSRRTEILRTSRNNNPDGIPLPSQGVKAEEDDELVVEIKPDADETLDYSNSSGNVPTTKYFL